MLYVSTRFVENKSLSLICIKTKTPILAIFVELIQFFFEVLQLMLIAKLNHPRTLNNLIYEY